MFQVIMRVTEDLCRDSIEKNTTKIITNKIIMNILTNFPSKSYNKEILVHTYLLFKLDFHDDFRDDFWD